MRRIRRGTGKLDVGHVQIDQMDVMLWRCVKWGKGDAHIEVILHNDEVHHKLKAAADVYCMRGRCLPHVHRCLLYVQQMCTT